MAQASATFGGGRSTARLLAILGKLHPNGRPTQKDILSAVGPFPVAGLAYWVDDWHAFRCCPFPHLHNGLDLMAAQGTPLVAAATGVVTEKVFQPDLAGQALKITDARGRGYFYAHLGRYAPGIHVGARVRLGDVIGYVGTTGNARGGPAHLHFEVNAGGVRTPPKPYVDSWLAMAEKRALKIVERRTGKKVDTKDLNLDAWNDQLLALKNAVNAEGAASRSARPPTARRRDQQVSAYAIPLLALALFLAMLTYRTRRRDEIDRVPSETPVLERTVLEGTVLERTVLEVLLAPRLAEAVEPMDTSVEFETEATALSSLPGSTGEPGRDETPAPADDAGQDELDIDALMRMVKL